MVSFLMCPVLVKFPALSGDHRPGQEAGDSEVPPTERAQTPGDCTDGRIESGLQYVPKFDLIFVQQPVVRIVR